MVMPVTKSSPLSALQERAVDALRHYTNPAPDLSDFDRRSASAHYLRSAAEVFIEARNHFFTREGTPDWLGRTATYRAWVRETYSLATVPQADLGTIQAAVRYHSGNVLREQLSPETLEGLGLRVISPRERGTERYERDAKTLAVFGSGGAAITELETILEAAKVIEVTLRRMSVDSVASLTKARRAEVRVALETVLARVNAILEAAK